MPRTPKPKQPKPIISRLSTNYSDAGNVSTTNRGNSDWLIARFRWCRMKTAWTEKLNV